MQMDSQYVANPPLCTPTLNSLFVFDSFNMESSSFKFEIISSLASKFQFTSQIGQKLDCSTSNTCHFQASEDHALHIERIKLSS